ncbi:MAG: UDP-3-O-acyl-N-acetylglucosamine deacetylase, partial [Candidatus Gastranaerophilales bacterium]|nr:UDP-3-O-acyl-N-acetylglucosamine deacetylase [Candidatus Gastranaerophilales bacterium]
MRTLKSNLKLSGAGLMFAAPVELEIKPSNKKGIRFFINNAQIDAKVENVVSTEHCVIV